MKQLAIDGQITPIKARASLYILYQITPLSVKENLRILNSRLYLVEGN